MQETQKLSQEFCIDDEKRGTILWGSQIGEERLIFETSPSECSSRLPSSEEREHYWVKHEYIGWKTQQLDRLSNQKQKFFSEEVAQPFLYQNYEN